MKIESQGIIYSIFFGAEILFCFAVHLMFHSKRERKKKQVSTPNFDTSTLNGPFLSRTINCSIKHNDLQNVYLMEAQLIDQLIIYS